MGHLRYNACGRPVYFVDDGWYNTVYVPRYRKQHGEGNGYDGEGNGNGHGRNGHGNGHGNGNGDN